MSAIIKYIIIILISLLVGWNIKITIDDDNCKNGICPVPKEYSEQINKRGIKQWIIKLIKNGWQVLKQIW